MSGRPDDGRDRGKFVSAAQRLPTVDVDCSSWESGIPAEQWTIGKLVSAAQRLPTVDVDCSHWDRSPALWLEIRVQFTADADLAVVEALTVKLIRAAAAAAPELGLTYDLSRSRPDGGDVIVALTPTNPIGAEGRLADIVRAIEGVLVERGTGVPGTAEVQWCPVA